MPSLSRLHVPSVFCNTAVILFLLAVAGLQGLEMLSYPISDRIYRPQPPNETIWVLPFYNTGLFLVTIALVAWCEHKKILTRPWRLLIVVIMVEGAVFAALTANIGSIDLYYYIAHGRKFAILGMDPYTPLLNVTSDPIINPIPPIWKHFPSFYGPTAILLFGFLNTILPAEILSLLIGFKVFFLLTFFVFSWLMYQLLKDRQPLPLTRWVALCANPIIWLLCLRDAHVEIVMLTLMAGCFLAIDRKRWLLAGVLLGMLCSIKAIMLALLPFIAWHVWQETADKQRVLRFIGGFAGYMLPLYILFNGGEFSTLMTQALQQHHCPQVISWAIYETFKILPFQFSETDPYVVSRWAANAVLLALLAAIAATLVLTRRKPDLMGICACVLALVTLTRTWGPPWYALWSVLPFILYVRTYGTTLAVILFFTLYALNPDFCGTRVTTNVAIIIAALWLGIKHMGLAEPTKR